jgi:hypothetical protein
MAFDPTKINWENVSVLGADNLTAPEPVKANPLTKAPQPQDWLVYKNQGAIRSQPLKTDLVDAMSFLPELGVTMEVFSGGQPSHGVHGVDRTGSHRHDHGGSGDVFFYKDGRRLDWANEADLPIFTEIVRRARRNGVTGIGAGPGYMQPGSMHIGYGNEAVWGKGGKGANAPNWLREAYHSYDQEAPESMVQEKATPDVGQRLMSDMMRDFGLTKAQAAAFAGNFDHESGGFKYLQELNPQVAGSDGGFGFGMWTGERRKNFEEYVKANNLDPASYEANYGFFKHEVQNDPYEAKQFAKVLNAETVEDAAKAVSDNYLRPGVPHMDRRLERAQAYYADGGAGDVDLTSVEWDSVPIIEADGSITQPKPQVKAREQAGDPQEDSELQTYFSDLEKDAPGRYKVIPEDQYEAWKADWDAQNQSAGVVGDTKRLLNAGWAGLGLGVREAVNAIPGVGDDIVYALDSVDEWMNGQKSEAYLGGQIDKAVATLTPATREARGKHWWDEEKNRPGAAWSDPRSYFAGVVESVPSMVATMGPSMTLARGAYVSAIASGASQRVAAASAARTAMVAGAVSEGIIGGGQAALSVRQQIEQMPRQALEESAAVKQLMESGMSVDEAVDAIADDAATQAFVIAGTATGVFGGFGDRVLAKIVADGVGGNIAQRIVQGAVREGVAEGVLEEAPQEALSQLGENIAMKNTVDPDRDVTEGVANAAAGGVAVGGAMGAGMGAGGAAMSPRTPDSGFTPDITPKKGVLAEAMDHGARETAAAAGSTFIINDPAFDDSPAGELNGVEVSLAPDQSGIAQGMRRVILPDGRTHVVGQRLLLPKEPVNMAPTQAEGETTASDVAAVSEDIPEGAPAAGTDVRIKLPDGAEIMARVEGYADGEAIVMDAGTGEVLQVPLSDIELSPAAAAAEPVVVAKEQRSQQGEPIPDDVPGTEPIPQEQTTGELPPASESAPVADVPYRTPQPGQRVIVAAEGIERFPGTVQSYEDGAEEALIRRDDGSEVQVPVSDLRVSKLTDKQIEKQELKENPPVERETITDKEPTAREVVSKQVLLPDTKHARLYDLGKLRRDSKRTIGAGTLDMDAVSPGEQSRLADEFGVSAQRLGQIADDYRYRVERAAKEAKSRLPFKMWPVNEKMLGRMKDEDRKEAATDAAFPVPEPMDEGTKVLENDWDKLPVEARKAVLTAAKVKRAPSTRWADFPANIRKKLEASLQVSTSDEAVPEVTPVKEVPAAPVTPPSFEDFKASLPKDAEGYPDLTGVGSAVIGEISGGTTTAWNGLKTDEQRAKAIALANERTAAKPKPADTLETAAQEAATSPANDRPEPTQAQKEAGNYKLGHVKLGGFDISIENPQGSERKGVDPNGKPWSVTMKSHYGYFKGTVGKDKDHIDTFIRPGTETLADSDPVFVIDQVNPDTKRFDEHKIMLGFKTRQAAEHAYKENYAKGWKGLGTIVRTNVGELKDWFANGDTSKPFTKRGKPTDQPSATKRGKQPDLSTETRADTNGKLNSDDVKSVLRSKEWKKVFGSTTNVNAETDFYAHPESEVAFDQAAGWLDAKAGRPPREQKPFTPVHSSAFNPRAPYLESYWGAKHGEARKIRASEAVSVYEELTAEKSVQQELVELADGSVDARDTPAAIHYLIKRTSGADAKMANLVASGATDKEILAEFNLSTGDGRTGTSLSRGSIDAATNQIKILRPDEYGKAERVTIKGNALAKEIRAAYEGGVEEKSDKIRPPKTVYHGTSNGGFETFDTYGGKYGLFGSGGYFTEDSSIAREYTRKGRGENPMVYSARLTVKNPLDMDALADVQAWQEAFDDYLDPDQLPKNPTNEQVYREVEDVLSDERLPDWEGAEIMQDRVRAMGHDAITHIGGGRHKASKGVRHRVWIVFDEDQVSDLRSIDEEPTKTEKIEDFGEKLEGARKDISTKLSESLQDTEISVSAEPLAKSFPAPNYVKLAEEGVPHEALATIALLRDSIPSKPRKNYKLQTWVREVSAARDIANQLLTGQANPDDLAPAIRDIGFDFKDVPNTAAALSKIEPADLTKAARWRIKSGSYSLHRGVHYSPSKTIYELVPPGKRFGDVYAFSIDELQEKAKDYLQKAVADSAATPERSKYTKLSLFKNRATGTITIGFKNRSSVIKVKDGFADVKAAREYVNEHRDDLQAQIDEMRAGPTMRNAENQPRSGALARTGDISPDDFAEAFGFRGVQFGNYVEGARRQEDLNRAYDALHDLSEAVGVPAKALSLNGELGLAFGARGRGGKNAAAAHFEPVQVVINLTKNAGPGSLAHEWLHAVDNYFARQDGGSGYMSDRRSFKGEARQEVFDAWKAIEKSVTGGTFSERSAEFDKARSKPYWNTTIEKAARAFERYVVDRLEQKGIRNDYLANINHQGGAYPNADEMSGGIAPAFDQLFDTIEVKTEPDGRQRMFSVAPKSKRAFQKWFGDSKVLDENGDPLVVFHGTGQNFEAFDPQNPMTVGGMDLETAGIKANFFTSNEEVAWQFAEASAVGDEVQERVISAYLKIEKPYVVYANGRPWTKFEDEVIAALKEGIHDGVIMYRVEDGFFDGAISDVYIVPSSNQIKSVDNVGNFDPSDGRIRYSQTREPQRALADLRSELKRGPVGTFVDRLLKDGVVRIVEARPTDVPDNVQAWTDPDGTITLVAPAIAEGTGTAVLLHEALHSGRDALVERKVWQALEKRLASLYRQHSRSAGRAKEFFDAARERIEAAGVQEKDRIEEFGAYAIEEYEKAPKILQRWADDAIGAVKSWALRRFGRQLGAVTPAQLRAMAISALKDKAKPSVVPTELVANNKLAFDRWFGDSKAVDRNGDPLVVYHGTRTAFDAFGVAPQNARTTADSDARKGFFFTTSKPVAETYAMDDGTGDKVRRVLGQDKPHVEEVYLSTRNPYVFDMSGAAYSERQFSDIIDTAKDNGHDGVLIQNVKDDGYGDTGAVSDVWVVFRPEQIKSVNNRGTFDPTDKRILFSKKVDKDEVKDQIAGRWTDLSPKLLSLVPLNYFEEMKRPGMDAVTKYMKVKRSMDTYRSEKHEAMDKVAQDWRKFASRNRKGAAELASLMHDSTRMSIDPSITYEGKEPAGYTELKARFDALPPAARALYKTVRNGYVKMQKEMDQLILDNVEKAQKINEKEAKKRYEAAKQKLDRDRTIDDLERREKAEELAAKYKADMTKSRWAAKARLTRLRQTFEKNRVPAPYFPLARFGDYFVSVRDMAGDIVSFSRFESDADRRRWLRANKAEIESEYPGVVFEQGVLGNSAAVRQAMDPRLVAEIDGILKDANVDAEVMDAIYQKWLQSMPDLSVRKRYIHRKGTSGFHQDALRAFASHMFHAGHQMGKLKYGIDLQEAVDDARDQAKSSDDPTRAGQLVNELSLRHDWVMNPKGSKFAQKVNSAAFVWYLAATPAAAIINMTQPILFGIPVLGAKLGGVTKASAALMKASTDVMYGKGDIINGRLTSDEKRAIQDLYASGSIDRTMAMEIAGIGDSGVAYSPLRHAVMTKISWMFHRAEVVNREVTALAAYRMARAKGMSHEKAVDVAHELNFTVNYDYANSSRPRILQSDFAKVAGVFMSYQLNVWYRIFRDIHQSFAGDTPQARKEARYQLAGLMGVQTLIGGTSGFFGYNVLMALAGLFFDDDDDPFSFKHEAERAIYDLFGENVGGMIINGVPGHLTGIDLTSRIGMADFFLRMPEGSKEGKDWWLEFVAGSMGASVGAVGNAIVGMHYMSEGDTARGLELMAPKAIKDAMKAWRYNNEGLLTRKGDVILPREDINAWNVIAQMSGFTPAKIATAHKLRGRKYEAQNKIKDERSALINRFATSIRNGDVDARKRVIEQIKAWNKRSYAKTLPITKEVLERSLKTRARLSARREDGFLPINEKVGHYLSKRTPENPYR